MYVCDMHGQLSGCGRSKYGKEVMADLGCESYGQSHRDVLNPDEWTNILTNIYSFKENISDNMLNN